MNDSDYKTQRKRVQTFLDKWYKPMGLEWFRVNIEWSRGGDKDFDSEETQAAASTMINWPYKLATVVFHLPAVEQIDDEHLEHVVVHEFTHILLGSQTTTTDSTPDERARHEYATELTANALIWCRLAGAHDAKKRS